MSALVLRTIALLITALVPLQSVAIDLRVPVKNTDNARVDWYFDTDRTVDSELDWNGGTKTYDQHQGIDINRNPPGGCTHRNGSNWCDLGDIVVAAHPGIVFGVVDKLDDHLNGCDPEAPGNSFAKCGNFGNQVRIEHSDGTITQYAHLIVRRQNLLDR